MVISPLQPTSQHGEWGGEGEEEGGMKEVYLPGTLLCMVPYPSLSHPPDLCDTTLTPHEQSLTIDHLLTR